jgi:hypothetical protein
MKLLDRLADFTSGSWHGREDGLVRVSFVYWGSWVVCRLIVLYVRRLSLSLYICTLFIGINMSSLFSSSNMVSVVSQP